MKKLFLALSLVTCCAVQEIDAMLKNRIFPLLQSYKQIQKRFYQQEITKFWLARHGETDWNIESHERVLSSTDIPLNENGKKQALELKKALQHIDFNICFSSNLVRASETAQLVVGDRVICGIYLDARLRARNAGKFEGQPLTDYRVVLAGNLPEEMGVETEESVEKRVFDFLQDMVDNHAGKNILMITHGGILNAIRNEMFLFKYGRPLGPRKFKNAEVMQLFFNGDSWFM